MSMFQWKSDYSVGHTAIDSQHQRLFQLADQLHMAMTTGKGSKTLGATLANLVSYTKMHFADEERLMKDRHYPGYFQHKKEHDDLTAKVEALQKDFDQNGATMTVQVMQFLKDWLTHHIGENDKAIAAYLKERAA